MKPDFFDDNGEPRHYNIWYPWPFVKNTSWAGKVSWLPLDIDDMKFVRLKHSDGSIRYSYERFEETKPIAWMFSRDGFYEI